jgi:peptidyl-prolyl cis-trans isomerase SurA
MRVMSKVCKSTVMVLALVVASSANVRAEIIDRVLAVVNGTVILQSDSRGALRLGLVEMPAGPEALRAVLDRLIERQLVLIEVNRSGSVELNEDEVEARMAQVRGRFATDAELQAALDENGLTPAQVRSFIRDDLRMAAYLQQRFGTTLEPSEAEVLAYYRLHPERFTRDGVLRPFNAVIEEARTMVTEERRATTTRDWIAGLRRRADVTIPAIVRR